MRGRALDSTLYGVFGAPHILDTYSILGRTITLYMDSTWEGERSGEDDTGRLTSRKLIK